MYDLTADDLHRSAVWEFALDEETVEGQDEATVRPFDSDRVLDPAAGLFIVRATFRLADGSQMSGYLTAQPEGHRTLGYVQPTIVTAGGQVSFWYGLQKPTQAHIDSQYKLLGVNAPSQVFPLDFQSEVALAGGEISGSVAGFYSFKNESFDETEFVR
ncbi:MAG: hypothetical protein K0Q76_3823 [Panacagrimonas sp.]|nr:hypothetical protein [Panacagrimonas sp.]MCC2658715.1 hypothetical protein [Panacagrimonas sp.]